MCIALLFISHFRRKIAIIYRYDERFIKFLNFSGCAVCTISSVANLVMVWSSVNNFCLIFSSYIGYK